MNRLYNVHSDAISVRYIYSACVKTSTPDVSILHDPWFTEGIYDGSWFHFPRIKNPLESIGNVDLIYVSHIHPDHYDGAFLKSYFAMYGTKDVLIANHAPNHLARKMRADGIQPTILEKQVTIGRTTIEIIPHKTGSISDIDSAMIVKYKSSDLKTHCLVNANDIIFDEHMRNTLKKSAGDVDILLCGYTGAGPYPQTYFDISDPRLITEASNKKSAFFERYKTLVGIIDAKVNIPFAGKYVLGGKLSKLNKYRGVSDPVEVLEIDSRAVVLADNGGEIDTASLRATSVRTTRYNESDIEERLKEISHHKMDFERLIAHDEIAQLPLKRLLISASRSAVSRSECDQDYFFCIKISDHEIAVINANKKSTENVYFLNNSAKLPTPRSEILIDPRYLFGLLTGVYHWNNAEVGSQYSTRRIPDTFNRKAQSFLNFLSV